MRFISYRTVDGTARVGILNGDGILPLAQEEAPGISPMRALLIAAGDRLGEVAASAAASTTVAIPLEEVEIAPIVPDPTKIVAAPVNYFDHKAEMQEDYHIDSLGVFLKAPSSVIAHGGVVRLPYSDRRFDQEGEIAVVIGRRASRVPAADAMSYVAGFTPLLDMTMRGGEDRSTRKSFDSFTPVGPVLVTPDEAGAPSGMRLRTWVNDVLRQDADVADLIWGIPELIEYISSVMVLEPGDIVTTGTPAGVGQVSDGDRVTVEISSVGRLEVAVSAAAAVTCPTKGASRGPKPPEQLTPIHRR